MKPKLLSAIILTFNEEIHLQRCLDSLKGVVDNVYIIDSYSTDATEAIALRNGAQFYQNKWVNYAGQFNWGLDNCPIDSEWVLRIDADEYLTPELQEEIKNRLPSVSPGVGGISLKLIRVFMNREIKKGMNTIFMIRLFRFGKARIEETWMDEHIEIFEGMIQNFEHGFADHNLNNFGWWINKHNGYSIREAVNLLDIEYNLIENNAEATSKFNEQTLKKKELKKKYIKSPLFLRSFLYFAYRYFFKLGFLEGKEGFLWHFMQGWWYRTLVDAKVYEIKKACGNDTGMMISYIYDNYNIDLKK